LVCTGAEKTSFTPNIWITTLIPTKVLGDWLLHDIVYNRVVILQYSVQAWKDTGLLIEQVTGA